MVKTGWMRLLVRLSRLLSLKKGGDVTDYRGTIRLMTRSLPLKGANLWILLCATVLTCVGLDFNSPTLLIGAMLISPLMNIVLSVGIFQATRDWGNLLLALRNLLIATIVCFLIGVIYFVFEPYGDITPAIMARSQPTLIDALIACVGAIAGVISLTRKEQLAALPGVAISITLMPPICTMSFACAQSHWTLFWGAFYLFLINAVVIASVSTIIVRMLGFPVLRTITKRQQIMRFHLGWVAIAVFLIPSYLFLVDNISKKRDKDRIENFVTKTFPEDSLTSVQWELVSRDTGNVVKIVYQGSVLNVDSIKAINLRFATLSIPNTWLQIVQPSINKDVVDHIAKSINTRVENRTSEVIDQKERIAHKVKEHFSYVKDIRLNSLDGKVYIATLEWRNGKLFTLSRNKKLRDI